MAWLKRTEDGGVWVKRVPGGIAGADGLLIRRSATFHPGDPDFPYWDRRATELGLPPVEAASEEGDR
jgi:hypothetical protein